MLNLTDREWADFKLSDIFDIGGTKCIYEKDMEQYGIGTYPHVCNSTENNGVSGFYNYYTEEGNVICTGDIVGWATYQPVNFSCGSHIQKLKPKFSMNKQIALFLVTAIRLETTGGKYGYGRLLNRSRLKEIVIHLPVDDSGQPDYIFMEQYIREREPDYSWATGCIEPDVEISLLDREWAEFRVGDIFDINKCDYGKDNKYNLTDNIRDMPVVSGQTTNNGVIGYVKRSDITSKIYKDCLTISTRGQYSGTVLYHEGEFVLNNNIMILALKHDMPRYVKIFMQVPLSNLGYGGYGNYPKRDEIMRREIFLPVDANGQPDYEFMEQYIKSLPFSKVLE